jgi:cellulose 1,4-beta-cellobiosidase
MALSAPVANAAPAHVDNPFAGATWYVNENWGASVEGAAQRAGGTLGEQMLAIADEPTFVWMDRISAITGNADGPGLRSHLDAALEQQQGSTPIVFGIVIYDLPGRDCYALASNGELPATDAGMTRYKDEYVDAIADLLAEPQYENIRFTAVIEPDSLPNLVTNSSHAACATAAPYYREGVTYALDELHAIPNVYTYVDAAHSGWLGWDSNFDPAIQLFAEIARGTSAGYSSIDGFVTNTANTTPLEEPFLTNPNGTVGGGGNPIRSSSYYEWNPYFDEADFTQAFRQKLVSAGFPSTVGMIVDTSRNGWGGPDRPTSVSASTDLNTYVNESRVDRRTHRGAWCNPLGAGIGERPTASPAAHSYLDAYVWVKPPGESDGSSSEIPNDEGKGFDRMCDPTFASDKLGGQLTGATPNAPVSGKWFEDQFRTLVANAYPPITGGGTIPDPTDTQAPSAPGTPTASAVTATSATISWPAATDDVGVTGYTVQNAVGATLATSSTTSTMLTGLTADTSYTVRVVARDAAGNVSPASQSVTFRTADDGTTPGDACEATLTIANSWPGGYQANVTVTASQAITGWSTTVTLASGGSIGNLWSAQADGSTGAVVVTNAPWNGALGAGSSTSFGFIGNGTVPAAGVLPCSAS